MRFALFVIAILYKEIHHKHNPCQSTHRVPDLELDLLPLDVDHASTELDADGEIVHRLEPLVRELEQQARLAHPWAKLRCREKTSSIWIPPTCVPDDDVLEQVAVGHGDCSVWVVDKEGGRQHWELLWESSCSLCVTRVGGACAGRTIGKTVCCLEPPVSPRRLGSLLLRSATGSAIVVLAARICL